MATDGGSGSTTNASRDHRAVLYGAVMVGLALGAWVWGVATRDVRCPPAPAFCDTTGFDGAVRYFTPVLLLVPLLVVYLLRPSRPSHRFAWSAFVGATFLAAMRSFGPVTAVALGAGAALVAALPRRRPWNHG